MTINSYEFFVLLDFSQNIVHFIRIEIYMKVCCENCEGHVQYYRTDRCQTTPM